MESQANLTQEEQLRLRHHVAMVEHQKLLLMQKGCLFQNSQTNSYQKQPSSWKEPKEVLRQYKTEVFVIQKDPNWDSEEIWIESVELFDLWYWNNHSLTKKMIKSLQKS